MDEATLMEEGRKALQAGDRERAAEIKGLIEQLRAQPKERPRMTTGQKIGQFINNTGEAFFGGLIGDETDAKFRSWVNGTKYDDELAKLRESERIFAEEHPYLDITADVTGGLASGFVGGAALKGLGYGAQATTRLANAGRNALAGGAVGATHGFMEGEGGFANRTGNALTGGAIGAAGGAIAPEAVRGLVGIARRAGITGKTAVQEAARILNVDTSVARQVMLHLDDKVLAEADDIAQDLGNDFMLADVPSLAPVLDTAAQSSPIAGRRISEALVDRAKTAGSQATDALDQTLGRPVGIADRAESIRKGGSAVRDRQYKNAYNNPIDYASPSGQALLDRLSRVPQSDRAAARRIMNMEGKRSRQRLISIQPDGSYSTKVLPDTREIDYITRALGDAAEATRGTGALRGMNTEGRAAANLQSDIRKLLKRLNPDYAKALGTAKTDIKDIAALEVGETMLTSQVTRSEFGQALRGMTGRERRMVMAGARDFLDDTLARVRPTMLKPDTDVAEAQQMVKILGSRDVQEKLRMLLPPDDADALLGTMQKSATMLKLLAETAGNSKTAFRQILQQTMRDAMEPGVLGNVARGQGVEAVQSLAQAMTGTTKHETNMALMRGFDALADALINTKGPQARQAVALLRQAQAGKGLTDEQVGVIASTLSGAAIAPAAPRADEVINSGARLLAR